MNADEMRKKLRAAKDGAPSPELMKEDAIQETIGPVEILAGVGAAGSVTELASLLAPELARTLGNEVGGIGKIAERVRMGKGSNIMQAENAPLKATKVILRDSSGREVPTESLTRPSITDYINSRRVPIIKR